MPEQRILHERYRVDELIGRGGMADVFRGHDLRLNRTVAVKLMRPDLARDPAFQARFRTEARNSAALNHPAIVSIYDTGATVLDDGLHPVECPYLVMEHVDGRTLRTLIDQGGVTWEEAVEWTRSLLEALEHSHRERIVHRDVKPANVMVTRSGQVKVMDFGIARALSDTSAQTGQGQAVVGTALYLPPEQALGGRLDARSDLYAAGCVLFELLTGRPPFTGDTPLAIAYQHVREEPPAPSAVDPSLPPGFDAVVLTALEKDPARRHQDARAFLTALEEAAADPHALPAGHAPDDVGRLPAASAASVGTTASATPDVEAATTPVPVAPVPTADGPAGGPRATAGARVDDTALHPGHAVAGAAVPGTASPSQLAAAASVGGLPPVTGSLPVHPPAAAPSQTPQGPVTESRPVLPAGSAAAPPPRHRRPRWVPWAVLLGVLAVLALGAALLLGRHDSTVAVPDLRGRSEADAVAQLTGLGLRSTVGASYDASVPDGHVITTSPGAGTEVPTGSDVGLTVSRRGEGVLLAPALRGQAEAAVRRELASRGLTVASVEETPSGDLARGALVATEPALGSTVAPGSSVVLHLSDGTARVPDLTGMTGVDARRTARTLVPEMTLRFQGPAGADPEDGVVVMQDPQPGALVDNDTTLTLITSSTAQVTAAAVTEPPADPLEAGESGGGVSTAATTADAPAAPGGVAVLPPTTAGAGSASSRAAALPSTTPVPAGSPSGSPAPSFPVPSPSTPSSPSTDAATSPTPSVSPSPTVSAPTGEPGTPDPTPSSGTSGVPTEEPGAPSSPAADPTPSTPSASATG